MKKKKYTENFKKEAMALAKRLGSASQAAHQLGVHSTTISLWMRKAGDEFKSVAPGINESMELERLRKENADLKMANEILKKAAAFFSQDHLK